MKWTFTRTIVYGRSADFSDIRFSHFADAAFLRECSGKILALQHMSLERSFGEAWSEKLLLIRQLCLELR